MASGYYEGEKGTYKLLEKKELEQMSMAWGVDLFAFADLWTCKCYNNLYVIRLSDVEDILKVFESE